MIDSWRELEVSLFLLCARTLRRKKRTKSNKKNKKKRPQTDLKLTAEGRFTVKWYDRCYLLDKFRQRVVA